MQHVLLVEPDKTLAETISKFLCKNGLTADVVFDAQHAVSAADKARPDVVVLELAMSKNNGAAFLQEFRSYTDWSNIPIIVYSRIAAEDTGLSRSEWLKQGVSDYLYKPTHNLASLLNHIQRNLNNYETA